MNIQAELIDWSELAKKSLVMHNKKTLTKAHDIMLYLHY